MTDIFSTEGMIQSGVIDYIWGWGWRPPTSHMLKRAEAPNPRASIPEFTDDGVALPKRAVIFVFQRELPDALSLIERSGNADGRYVIVARDGDMPLDRILRAGLPSYVHHLFAVYAPAGHPRITRMPFGVRWLDNVDRIRAANVEIPRTIRNRVLVCHRKIGWLRIDHERNASLSYFRRKPWATVHEGRGEDNPLGHEAYLREVRSHEFFVVGGGSGGQSSGGIERIAQWEALALGAIPICTRRQECWSDMVAIVDRWEDVTPEWCEENDSKTRNVERMTLSYWVAAVRQKAMEL